MQALYMTMDLLSTLVPTFSLELNPLRYEGSIPPANTSRAYLELSGRFELPTPDYKTGIFPAKLQEHDWRRL